MAYFTLLDLVLVFFVGGIFGAIALIGLVYALWRLFSGSNESMLSVEVKQ